MKNWLKYLSEALCGGCLGVIIDFIAKQSYLFTLLGLVAGIIFAVIHIIKDKKKERN